LRKGANNEAPITAARMRDSLKNRVGD